MDNELTSQKPQVTDIRFEVPTFIDPLTGLFNRYYLYQFLPEEIKKAGLNNYPLALLMIDLDGFKKVNDTYGHLCGDKVLTQVSGILKKAVRQTDTVIRYAGDEFMVFLPAAGKEKTPMLCERFCEEVQKAVFIGDKNQNFHLTLSIGYAIYPEDAREQTKLIDMADKAVYLSKKRGRNIYSSAKEVTVEEVSSLVAMESFPCRKFINQKQEFAKLKEIFDGVIKFNSLQAVFISGISGVGKSRVMKEIKAYLQGQGGSCIFCDSSSVHTQDPYYLFAAGIGAYIDSLGIDNPQITDILLKVPLPESSELSLIIPQIRNIVKKSTDLEADDKKRRFLLFKAFVDFITELNSFSPILINFDDLQWADKASLELLRYLIKQEKNRNIYIICAFPEDKSLDREQIDIFGALLKEINLEPNVTNIKLGNLLPQDAIEMIDAIFPGIGKSREFVGLIYDVTKGNPSFIEEMLKSLIENGVIFYQNDSWQIKPGITKKDIPASLEDIIKGRLKALDDETKEMIIQAAVIGQNFQIDILKKIGDKDEGFVSEIINRAKKMRLVDELETSGRFNFINKNTQDILYNQLDEEQRTKMHYKIAQTLANQHKDNLYDVAGEAAFHFSRSPQQERAADSSRELLEKTAELFDPDEVTEYIEQLAKDLLARKEKTFKELGDEMMKEATKFVIFLLGAIKKFRLYPPASSVRLNTVKEVYQILNGIFAETESLVISEVEKSLVINGKRLSPSEAKYTNAEHLLSIIMEHNIKTIAFKRGLKEEELGKFIHWLSQARKEVADAGGWVSIIHKEGLEHLGLDEVLFTSISEYSTRPDEKKKLQDFMLMEFLLGKVDNTGINKRDIINNIEQNPGEIAKSITEITNAATQKDKNQDEGKVAADVITKISLQILSGQASEQSHVEALSKVILQLEPKLRNKVIRSFSTELRKTHKKVMDDTIGVFDDDFMVDMIVEEYKNNPGNPLITREFMNDVLVKEDRKKIILNKLESQLLRLSENKQGVFFIVGKTEWKDLPQDERVDMLIGLPREGYTVSVLSKIGNLLEELDSIGKKEALKRFIFQLLIKAWQIEGKARKDLLGIIMDFIKESFSGSAQTHLQIASRIGFILEGIENEAEPVMFS
ncbi:MAG: diguanylate cyclase, partial [Candidatus Omnitrophica bacterium]|nr:diguanylate cyclase [Candidatus Omnitrophota bacterium]